MHRAVIVGAKRTPIGSFMGALQDMNAPHLGTAAARAALISANVDPTEVEEVYMGNVLQGGVGQAPARQVALGCEMGYDTPSTTINKVCASGMKSVMMAAQAIQLGQRNVMVAGGMESMSKSPHYVYLRRPTGFGEAKMLDSIKYDGLTDVYNQILMGSCVEKLNSDMGITREAQDEFAIQSYEKARAAQEAGFLDWEITEIIQQSRKGEVKFARDEECTKFMPDKFPGLKPAFAKNGTITPANASKINDGAAAMVIMSEQAAKDRGLKPLARIVAYEDAAVQPIDFGIAPAKACDKLLRVAGMSMKDIEYHEINEAFSAVALANMKLLDLDPATVNVHGGAVALGHPIGVSGTRILMSLMNVLRRKDATMGMASICNGGGGASAVILERLD
jgi:acetyl-CoA C-acetyltransferase